MRPKGLIGLLVVALVVGVIFYLLSDSFIEGQIEGVGESIVGAKVEIDNLDFSLVGLSISMDRLQVTNPNDTWKNLFETGRVAFDMEVPPLVRKKVIINDITVADIRIGTRRETDGAIPKSEQKEESEWVKNARESLMQQIDAVPVLNLGVLKKKINVDSLLANFDIQTLDRIEDVKQDADSTYQHWQKTITEFDPKEELNRIQTQIAEIKTQEIRDVDNLISTFEKSKQIYNTLNDLKQETQQKKNRAVEDFKRFTGTFSRVDNWLKDDFNALKSKANLGEFSPQNIGKMLFGQKLSLPTIDLLESIDVIRKYMPIAEKAMQFTGANKVEKPPRLEGQDIRFPLRDNQPNFLIEKIFISGATNQADTSDVISGSGEITGITSHPAIYGKPLTFALQANLPQSRGYRLTGEIDHTGDIPAERFELKAAGIPIGGFDLPARAYLPSKIKSERGDVTTTFGLVGKELDFGIDLTARPVSFGFADSLVRNDLIAQVTSGVFKSIDHLQLAARISGPIKDLSLRINTNIDNILAERIKGVLGETVKVARAEIETRLNEIVEPKKQEALALVDQHQNQVTTQINQIESRIDAQLAVVEQKQHELEDRIKKEKEKGVEEAKKKLKDIFKKNE